MHLVREVVDQGIQCMAVLARPVGFKIVREHDRVLEISDSVLATSKWLQFSQTFQTHWLSLSTRSAKLSAPSMAGTPASSVGHLDIDSSDIFGACLLCVCEVQRQKSRNFQLRTASRLCAVSNWQSPKRHGSVRLAGSCLAGARDGDTQLTSYARRKQQQVSNKSRDDRSLTVNTVSLARNDSRD